MPFYAYHQGNPGGRFDESMPHCLIVEANSTDSADAIARSAGVYFNGVDHGMDCSCCNDRWYPASDYDARNTPVVYDLDLDPSKTADDYVNESAKKLLENVTTLSDAEYRILVKYANGDEYRVSFTMEHLEQADAIDRANSETLYGFRFNAGSWCAKEVKQYWRTHHDILGNPFYDEGGNEELYGEGWKQYSSRFGGSNPLPGLWSFGSKDEKVAKEVLAGVLTAVENAEAAYLATLTHAHKQAKGPVKIGLKKMIDGYKATKKAEAEEQDDSD